VRQFVLQTPVEIFRQFEVDGLVTPSFDARSRPRRVDVALGSVFGSVIVGTGFVPRIATCARPAPAFARTGCMIGRRGVIGSTID
jgi:hypothetical protein